MEDLDGEVSSTNSSQADLSWQPLRLSPEKLQLLWEKAQAFPSKFDDVTCGDYEYFVNSLADPGSMFFEIGDALGLISISSVRLEMDGLLHFVFFDRKMKGKEDVLWAVLREAFRIGKLRRMTVALPEDRYLVLTFLVGMGFKIEGRMRKGFKTADDYVDTLLLGLLREELPDAN